MKKRKILFVLIVLVLLIGRVNGYAAEVVESKFGVNLYGKIKADLSLDDSAVDTGNYYRWVDSEVTAKDVAQMNLTAAETRLGLNFQGPDDADFTTSGNLEVDFFDTSLAENKARLYLRHAYAKVVWPYSDFSILAGQTWDIVAPLNPTTLNYTVMWWQGNLSYRRPQVRLTKGMEIDINKKLLFEAAAARNIGDANGVYTTLDTGTNNAAPIWEGRVSISLPLLMEKKSIIGISAAFGAETVYTSADAKASKDYDVSLIALDMSLPLIEGIMLKGEYFTGENLDAFLGGIGQGINTSLGKSIEASGGWAAISYTPDAAWNFNLGYGIDDPDDADIAAGAKAKNTVFYANVIYSLNEAVKLGLEVAGLETTYKGQSTKADAARLQTSMIYTF